MANTFPHLLLSHATQRPTAPALREKEFGIWQTWTWADVARDLGGLEHQDECAAVVDDDRDQSGYDWMGEIVPANG